MSPESGRVLVDGRDVATDPVAARRALGVLPDARGVYQRLTARENIQYFGELPGLPSALVHERLGNYADALTTADMLERPTEVVSQGQPTTLCNAHDARSPPDHNHPKTPPPTQQ